MKKKQKEEEQKVNFCETCKTDLRSLQNVKYHMDLGHRIVEYKIDPRGYKNG